MTNMVSQTDERIISVHQEHEFLKKLETAGLDSGLAQRVIDSKGNDLAKKVVRLIQNGGFEPTTSQKCAREIMGKNFLGIEEAIKHFGVNPTRPQLAALSEIPFSEEVLEKSKDTHILVAVFPLSIIDIHEKVESSLFYNYEVNWCNKQSFAKERDEVTWKLARKTPADNSISKSWQEQQALVGKDNEVPSSQVMVYTIIGHYLASGERLFENIYVRTSSVALDGGRVVVGCFDSEGLDVDSFWDKDGCSFLGVASSRKF